MSDLRSMALPDLIDLLSEKTLELLDAINNKDPHAISVLKPLLKEIQEVIKEKKEQEQ